MEVVLGGVIILDTAVDDYENRESARKEAVMRLKPSPIWRTFFFLHLAGFAQFSAFRSQLTHLSRFKNSPPIPLRGTGGEFVRQAIGIPLPICGLG